MSLGQKDELDRFYTKKEIADFCVKQLDISDYSNIIEPSAGQGVFLEFLPEKAIGIDIAPENEKIEEKDFFDFSPKLEGKTLVIGNPPFGRQGQLAIKFFNHAAQFADTIAFIVPKSFLKTSIQNRLDLRFYLEKNFEIPFDSFTLEGKNYSVPCVFQIWKRGTMKREKTKFPMQSQYITFIKEIEQADFRIQRVGGNAGKAFLDKKGAPSSNYYVINTSSLSNTKLVEIINQIAFPSIEYTVGPKSLPKGELCYELEKYLQENKNVL